MKLTSDGTVSHYLGSGDSQTTNLWILSACLGVPTGPAKLCSTVLSENGGAPAKLKKLI